MLKKEHVYSSNDDLNNEDIALIARKFVFKKQTMKKIKMAKILPKEMSQKIKVKVKLNLRK